MGKINNEDIEKFLNGTLFIAGKVKQPCRYLGLEMQLWACTRTLVLHRRALRSRVHSSVPHTPYAATAHMCPVQMYFILGTEKGREKQYQIVLAFHLYQTQSFFSCSLHDGRIDGLYGRYKCSSLISCLQAGMKHYIQTRQITHLQFRGKKLEMVKWFQCVCTSFSA